MRQRASFRLHACGRLSAEVGWELEGRDERSAGSFSRDCWPRLPAAFVSISPAAAFWLFPICAKGLGPSKPCSKLQGAGMRQDAGRGVKTASVLSNGSERQVRAELELERASQMLIGRHRCVCLLEVRCLLFTSIALAYALALRNQKNNERAEGL